MTPTKYADRSRCEAAGLGYEQRDVIQTLAMITAMATLLDVERLDTLSAQLSLQSAAFLESQYERAGVISGGEAK